MLFTKKLLATKILLESKLYQQKFDKNTFVFSLIDKTGVLFSELERASLFRGARNGVGNFP